MKMMKPKDNRQPRI